MNHECFHPICTIIYNILETCLEDVCLLITWRTPASSSVMSFLSVHKVRMGSKTVCESLVGAVLRGFSHQCDIVVIEHGGTCIARTRIARYDRLWTHCHVCISSHPLIPPCSLTRWLFSPSHHLLSMFQKECFIQRFCQHVCHLLSCCNMVYADCSFLYLFSEMMIFDIEMFCSRSHLGDLCYFNCSFIVFKYFTMNSAWSSICLNTSFLHLSH